MGTSLEDLRVLRAVETIADDVWKHVMAWDAFARDTVGGQFVRAIDSVGANIAESYGRFHYGEKLHHLYFARGSLFETKYWINRARARHLLHDDQAQQYAAGLTDVARQLNVWAKNLKHQRSSQPVASSTRQFREVESKYHVDLIDELNTPLFTDEDLIQLLE